MTFNTGMATTVTYIGRDKNTSTFGSLEEKPKHVVLSYLPDPRYVEPTDKDLVLTVARELGLACVPGKRVKERYGHNIICRMRIIG